MSRIGKMPVAIPAGVEVTVADGNLVTVKGPKGTLTQQLQPSMTIKQEGAELLVSRPDDGKENRALHGLTRALLHNMVVGVRWLQEDARSQRRWLSCRQGGPSSS